MNAKSIIIYHVLSWQICKTAYFRYDFLSFLFPIYHYSKYFKRCVALPSRNILCKTQCTSQSYATTIKNISHGLSRNERKTDGAKRRWDFTRRDSFTCFNAFRKLLDSPKFTVLPNESASELRWRLVFCSFIKHTSRSTESVRRDQIEFHQTLTRARARILIFIRKPVTEMSDLARRTGVI